MQTEDLVVDKGSQWKIIEQICEVFPDIGVSVFSQTFIVKAIDLGNLARLVVTAENGDALGVSNFECNEECHRLDREIATINIITCLGSATSLSL